eukprot:2301119-Ditylum_brightwellii.AAC.1
MDIFTLSHQDLPFTMPLANPAMIPIPETLLSPTPLGSPTPSVMPSAGISPKYMAPAQTPPAMPFVVPFATPTPSSALSRGRTFQTTSNTITRNHVVIKKEERSTLKATQHLNLYKTLTTGSANKFDLLSLSKVEN